MKAKIVFPVLLVLAGFWVARAVEETPAWRIHGDGATAYAAPMVEHPGMALAAQQKLDRTYSRGCLRLTADIRTPAKWTGSPGHGTSLRVGLAPVARTAMVAARQTIGEFGPDFQKSGRTTKAFALTRDEAGRAAGRVMEVARAEAWYRYTVTFDLEKQTYSGTVCDRESGASAGAFEGAKFCRAFDPKDPIGAVVVHVKGLSTGFGSAFCAADAGGIDNLKLEWQAPGETVFKTVFTCDYATRTGARADQPLVGRAAGLAPKIEIDFTRPTGPINKWLHCAGYCSRSYPRGLENDDADLKPLHLTAARTHDWALVNSGQRLVDTQYIFPLLHLDPSDPKNYIFEPTDRVLSLTQNIGMKIFYRLGTSIEHTADWGFNTLNPTNHAQYAEALAGIVRHYTQGWANGFKWDIQNWEIYNEPNIVPCWRGTKAEFIDLFVTCLKRLKREFPDLNFGGPAFAGCPLGYMKELLLACRAAGVEPDFVSWHYYGQDPDDLVSQPARVRRFLDGLGFTKCKLVIDEWHYIVSWDGIHGASSPARIRQAHAGPSAHNGIDSGVFNLAVLAGFQNSCLDQSYFYGSGAKGSWGWKNGYGEYNKSYYSLKIFGDIVTKFTRKVAATAGEETTVSAFAGLSADGKKAFVLVADYRGRFPLVAHIKGLDSARVEKAIVLDHTRNNEPVEVAWRNGTLTLPRKDRNSAAFYVVFACPSSGIPHSDAGE